MSVLDLPLERHPFASIRPERFGALVYHSGNRRLLFLKSAQLAAVVESLAEHENARATLAACGIVQADHDSYSSALDHLIDSEVIRVRHT